MRKIQSLQKIPYPAPDVVTKMVPVPTDGWDAISPLATMDPKRAPIMDNFVPRPGWVELRKGYSIYNNVGASDPVETIIVYRDGIGEQLFACAGSTIYEVTAASPTPPVASWTAQSSARHQWCMFTPLAAEPVAMVCNGVDPLLVYRRSLGWELSNITGWPAGMNSSNTINVWAAKRRLWFVMGSNPVKSTLVAYLPVDAMQGPLDGYLDLGAMMTKGGYIVAMSSWTIDGGAGPGDYTAFLSSRWQIMLYAGTDPSNASAWSLVGTFEISPPISLRCMSRVGSDVGIITQQGLVPISQSLPFDPSADRSVAITARIQNAMAQATNLYGNYFGWQFITYPGQQLAILNVPVEENVQAQQFVMNTLTGAWTRFTGWNANCFEIYYDNLYFGDNNGNVCKAWDTSLDNGLPIQFDMQCAFNYFDDPGRLKRMTMVQPLFIANGQIRPTISVDADFVTTTNIAPITTCELGPLWGTAIWGVDKWGNSPGERMPFLSAQAIGRALAVHISLTPIPTGDMVLKLNAFNAIMELGGFV